MDNILDSLCEDDMRRRRRSLTQELIPSLSSRLTVPEISCYVIFFMAYLDSNTMFVHNVSNLMLFIFIIVVDLWFLPLCYMV